MAAVAALIFANSPVARRLRHGARHLLGPEWGDLRAHRRALGRPTACSPSSSSSPGSSSSASSSSATCARRPRPRSRWSPPWAGSSCPALVFLATVTLLGGRGRRPARLGDPHGDGHRLRPRRARRHRVLAALRAALVPADPRGGRRPHRDHDHRDLLHHRPAGRPPAWPRWCRWASSRPWSSAGSPTGGCCCPSPSRRGRSCTPRGCTPRWPACCSGSSCRSSRAPRCRRSAPTTARPTSPTASSTGCGPSRRASPCRCSPSSPPGCRRRRRLRWPRSPTPSPSGVIAGLVVGKLVGVFGST